MFSDNLGQWKEIISTAAVITTIVQFLSGSLVCQKFIQKGSTGDSSGFSFVCGFLSCSLWLKYGLLKNDNSVVFVNTIGATLQLVYIIIYCKYTIKKSLILTQFLSICVILGIIYGYTEYEDDISTALERTGLICCIVTLIFIGAPLTMLFHVIRVRSTEALPFPIIVTSFFVSTLWYLYGVIIDDAYMELPNAIGAVLAAFQLSLFVCYSNSPNTISYSKLGQLT